MKKACILFLFSFIPVALSAQYDYTTKWPSRFRVGFDGSASLVSFFGNITTEKTDLPTLGFNSGIFVQYSFTQIKHPDSTGKTSTYTGLKTGFYFERKGVVTTPSSLASGGFPPGNTTIHNNLDYITMPILVQFMMGRSNRAKVYQIFGPYFSVLLNQSSIHEKPDTASVTYHQVSAYQPIDIGLTMGLGLEIPFKQKFHLHMEFRHNVGLFNINRSATLNNAIIQTSATNLMIGFSYRFSRNKPPKIKE